MVERSDFSVSAITSLESLPRGAAVHVVGICGVAMAPLALLLAERGFVVTGSDKEFYPPFGDILFRSGIKLFQGYKPENIPERCDLVVIANAISPNNPELEGVFARKLPYSIFPQLLRELVIGNRHSIVVSGTHGKTTTSALLAHVLREAGQDPAYFVGGVVHGFEHSLHVGKGAYCITEGDEYDSSFFAKVPKFYFYAAQTQIVTSVEFDHADIYRDLAHVQEVFVEGLLKVTGAIVACTDDPGAIAVAAQAAQRRAAARIVWYGSGSAPNGAAQWRLVSRNEQAGSQHLVVTDPVGQTHELKLSLAGNYNAANAVAALAALDAAGVTIDTTLLQAFGSFLGVRRRQEIRKATDSITIIEDFAHHPTAVAVTLQGIKERHPGKRVWAVFEPRSNTSRRRVFQQAYREAFCAADEVVFMRVQAREIDKGLDLISVEELAAGVRDAGGSAHACDSVEEIVALLKAQVRRGDVVVVMSNGSFGGLIGQLVAELH